MDGYMKFDMHCHTKEGSPDAKVPVSELVNLLKKKEFDGLLITDHDSYKGYRAWQRWKEEHPEENFVVLRGIEYDTKNAGHILVILPEHVRLRLMEVRGMSLEQLERLVHMYGGVMGPAHPFGAGFVSMMHSRNLSKYFGILKKMDFIEVFNMTEPHMSNEKAKLLAQLFKKPGTAGTDAHRYSQVGNAYTYIQGDIRTTDDLIYAIRNQRVGECGGRERAKKKPAVLTAAFPLGFLFHCYNKGLALTRILERKKQLRKQRNVFGLKKGKKI